MSDDFDPEVADALRRFAGSAPQPHEDRLQSVVAGVRRRQVRVISASAVSVVALVTATAFGVHSWRNTADSGPVGTHPVTSSPAQNAPPPASPVASSPVPSGPAPISPDASSPAPHSPTAHAVSPRSSSSASAAGRRTPSPSDPNFYWESWYTIVATVQVTPKQVALGQQVRVTVTITNDGLVYDASAQPFVNTSSSGDTFTDVPQACTTTSPPGGVQCNTGTLRPGQKVSFSFTLIPALLGVDQIYGQVYWANKMGQPQTGLFNEQVTVVDGTTPSPPSSVMPSPTGTTSPSARSTSTAPSGAPPTS